MCCGNHVQLSFRKTRDLLVDSQNRQAPLTPHVIIQGEGAEGGDCVELAEMYPGMHMLQQWRAETLYKIVPHGLFNTIPNCC